MPWFGAWIRSNTKDSFENYFDDTLDGGCYINDENLVKILVEKSGDAIGFLEGLGVRFDRGADGSFIYGGGVEKTKTRTARGLTVDDCMGRTFYNALSGEIGRRQIHLLEDFFVVSLLIDSHKVRGAFAIDIRGGRFVLLLARAVILATGGVVGLYNVRTGHPRDTADGHAMAYRVGVPLKDMEFLQSNPAAIFYPEGLRGVLCPGWYLFMDRGTKYYNGNWEEFLHLYDPERRESTTRDIKARAMQNEINAGRGSIHGGIYLDFSKAKLEKPLHEYLEKDARFMLDYVRKCGLPPEQIINEPVEVGPAAHYTCGGIEINERSETVIPGLFAAGEVTGGIHGANRLGNSAMTDIFVFGKIAAETAVQYVDFQKTSILSRGLKEEIRKTKLRLISIFERDPVEKVKPEVLKKKIEEILWKYVGFSRTGKGLNKALDSIKEIEEEVLPRTFVPSRTKTFNYDWVEIIELENMLEVGKIMTNSALARKETRGCHNRLDFPDQDDKKCFEHVVVKNESGKMLIDTSPIFKLP
jgi:succinate dehydrogenase/fumarate reductase flavoprotein subunit